eukprot:3784662-Ditylum_brightwellii.AAC.1
MKQTDQEEFIKAIVKEINGQVESDHWELVKKSKVPMGTKILDSVWAFKCKQDIKTSEALKYKARLNVHGGQQVCGVYYFDTYAPVVTWYSVQMALILSIINPWHTHQIYFIMVYPHADIKFNLYMKLPHDIETIDDSGEEYGLIPCKS